MRSVTDESGGVAGRSHCGGGGGEEEKRRRGRGARGEGVGVRGCGRDGNNQLSVASEAWKIAPQAAAVGTSGGPWAVVSGARRILGFFPPLTPNPKFKSLETCARDLNKSPVRPR